jgi:hypothetical protein
VRQSRQARRWWIALRDIRQDGKRALQLVAAAGPGLNEVDGLVVLRLIGRIQLYARGDGCRVD